jgi:hypothetical protein
MLMVEVPRLSQALLLRSLASPVRKSKEFDVWSRYHSSPSK